MTSAAGRARHDDRKNRRANTTPTGSRRRRLYPTIIHIALRDIGWHNGTNGRTGSSADRDDPDLLHQPPALDDLIGHQSWSTLPVVTLVVILDWSYPRSGSHLADPTGSTLVRIATWPTPWSSQSVAALHHPHRWIEGAGLPPPTPAAGEMWMTPNKKDGCPRLERASTRW